MTSNKINYVQQGADTMKSEMKAGEWIALHMCLQNLCDHSFIRPDLSFKLDDFRIFASRVHSRAIKVKDEMGDEAANDFLKKEVESGLDPLDMTWQQFRGAIKEDLKSAREAGHSTDFTPKELEATKLLFPKEEDIDA